MSQFDRYIRSHLLRKNPVGKSGANVYELDNGWVVKHIRRSDLQSASLWETYLREAKFYTCFSAEKLPFLPEIAFCSHSGDEIQIIMKQYRPLRRGRPDGTQLERVLAVLAQIHRLPIPEFLSLPAPAPAQLKPADIEGCLRGWLEVLEEHGNMFSKRGLYQAAENINAINRELHSAGHQVCHGDFHFDNLLSDEAGNIIVCDWQGVHSGHVAGDISFFLSRLSADGGEIPRKQAINVYCRLPEVETEPEEIAVQMALANLNTSFLFWHQYLHGSPADRVRGIFLKMIDDLDYLTQYKA